ncbi:phosphoesterase-domain-containing protein [Lepidopterella palustris CBS 459.81]|uniref:Phosphoesterase-domain-containing protein n=1 Tax=Lepidopterella palustris CBS 459.81 TaxID=1314670 RepID=A0A8E2DWH4_9PEZI|nr:phosphoesterase-domain-containing protein [Lepidopterella palustris CBS 459.81]
MYSSSLLAFALTGANVVLGASSASYASRPPFSTIAPSLSQVVAAEATASALSPTSNVSGKGFDRIIQIWLENTDYEKAFEDPNLQALAKQGISLTNYWGVTHPSEPNYAASVAGDYFGMENDDFISIAANVSTVVDLLDTKGISWGEYQESLPYAGYTGFNFTNQQNTSNNDYVRKHNPLILFDSVANNATRLSLIKNFTSFYSDLAAKTLPQWSFITPNMTNDGHDTTITFAASWAKTFLTPLLNNTYLMNNTLIILSFDEVETYTAQNKVFTILLGGAIPDSAKGTTDNTFYTHYSTLSTVEMNWGLPSLGRWDCGANVLQVVANKTGYTNQVVDTTNLYLNVSYPGPLSDKAYIPTWPAPNTNAKCVAGNGVLGGIVSTWGKSDGTYNYTNVFPSVAAGVASTPTASASGTAVKSGTPTGSAAAGATSSGAASLNAVNVGAGVAALVAAFL